MASISYESAVVYLMQNDLELEAIAILTSSLKAKIEGKEVKNEQK